MKQHNFHTPPARALQQGRTLVELMISMTIGLAIVAAIMTVYLSTTSTSRQSNAVTRMSEDAAIGFTMIGNYLRVDGYSQPRVLLSVGSATVNGVSISPADRNFTGMALRGCDNGFASVAAAFDSLTCASTGVAGQSALAMRFEGDLDSTLPVNGNPSDCLSNEVTGSAASAVDGSNYKLIDSRLFVSTAANGTPELYCAGNGGATPYARQPLLQFVEAMALTYGVANNSQGRNVTNFMTQAQLDASSGTTASRWGRVVSVRACLVMRSQDTQQESTQSYVNCEGNSVTTTDGFSRRAFTSVFTLRNRNDLAG